MLDKTQDISWEVTEGESLPMDPRPYSLIARANPGGGSSPPHQLILPLPSFAVPQLQRQESLDSELSWSYSPRRAGQARSEDRSRGTRALPAYLNPFRAPPSSIYCRTLPRP